MTMSDQSAALLLWLIVLAPVGVFARQIQQVRNGAQGKWRGTALFLLFSVAPVLAYAMGFLVLIGVEELAAISVIGEGSARTLTLVIGIAMSEVVLLTAIFTITAIVVCPARKPGSPP
jgi:hypothetical protein